MQNCVIYISGLFEDLNDPLFFNVSHFLQKNKYICEGVELYKDTQFGAYSFQNEIERIQKAVDGFSPTLIIAHSLGGYVALHLKVSCPILLLEPSVSVADIFLPNLKIINGEYYYENKERTVNLSSEFVESLKQTLPIESLSKIGERNKVCIVGAGLAGYQVAEKYHAILKGSGYVFIPNATHNFMEKQSLQIIKEIIKKLVIVTL